MYCLLCTSEWISLVNYRQLVLDMTAAEASNVYSGSPTFAGLLCIDLFTAKQIKLCYVSRQCTVYRYRLAWHDLI